MGTKPRILGLVTDEGLKARLTALLPEFEFHWGLELPVAIQTAADLRPALLLIDVDDAAAQWKEIVLGLQSSPATRRIPMLGIAAQADETSLTSAASLDGLLARDALDEQLPDWVARRARVWDEAYYQALQKDCAGELPELARRGIELFDHHEFWEAHEVLESAWIEARGQPIGEVYRSILQVGVAYYHIQKRNYRGAIKMFLRAVQWLDPLPDECHGIDVAQFKRDAAAARAALEALGAERIADFDPAFFKPIPFIKQKETSEGR